MMFSAQRPSFPSIVDKIEPTEQVVALIARLNALAVHDRELAKLLDELGPYLPVHTDPANADSGG